MALAQALQFELMLRQKDVIGEWVPLKEPGISATVGPKGKWISGLRWEEIDQNLILRHTTSKRGKDIEVDLKLAPMVLEELALLTKTPIVQLTRTALPVTGPVILCEVTGWPYTTAEFRRKWRIVANEAGIPKEVRSMDSRAGAISEATDAGADLEHVRHAATHSDIAMTQRYSRGSTDKVAGVSRLRVAHRNKPKTSE
jgi:site-specific recombinase XerD